MRVFTALIKKICLYLRGRLICKVSLRGVFTVLTKEGASYKLPGVRFVGHVAVLAAENAQPGVVVADAP